MTIGERLLKYRKANGLSQEEVAETLEVTRQTISKWETDQSTPDFDKIIPLCELFKISADELLTGKQSGNDPVSLSKKNEDISKKISRGMVLSISIFFYFLSIVWCIFADEVFHLNDGLIAGIFLLLVSFPTCLLIYYFMDQKREVKKLYYETRLEKKEHPLKKALISILSLLTTCIYVILSFITGAWNITWIIWLIFAALVRLIDLVFELRGDENRE